MSDRFRVHCDKELSMNTITALTLAMPLRMGTVNCYLVQTSAGYLLIDTGTSNRRNQLVSTLTSEGCEHGNLRLVLLTHGDFDHTGNAAYLRREFGTQIAMHQDDTGMAEHADMFWNRSSGNPILRRLAPALFGFPRSDRFVPDLYVDDGYDLSEYGLDAQVLSLPGHSKGSIGILTGDGDFFCGDLLENTRQPSINGIMDDSVACQTSIAKLQSLEIDTIYPGHGQPFAMEAFLAGYRAAGPG
jgi:hydroxyacylglutathione hydrolase